MLTITTIPDGHISSYGFDRYAQLSGTHRALTMEHLYTAYQDVCKSKGIEPMPFIAMKDILNKLNHTDHRGQTKKLFNDRHILTRIEYNRIKFIESAYTTHKHQHRWANINITRSMWPQLSNASIVICLLLIGDLLWIAYVLISKYQTYSAYLLLARSGAIVILFNLCLLLVHMSNVLMYLDFRLVHKLTTNAASLMHKVFGLKIVLGTVAHIIGHMLHVRYVLNKCLQGCTAAEIIVIPSTTEPLSISWEYFLRMPAYYSGIVLTILLGMMLIDAWLQMKDMVRTAGFYNRHRVLSITMTVGTVLHGLQQLLGFNLSYIFVLPSLLLYLWSRYRELLLRQHVEILAWHATDSVVRICLSNTPYLAKQLEYGVSLSAYIRHALTSSTEWHPFTITNGLSKKESYISIRKTGRWTAQFIKNIASQQQGSSSMLITLGHVVPSCFRFYKFYPTKIFFCSGIGITPFLSIIDDPYEYTSNNLLIWSVNSIELLREFCPMLSTLKTIGGLEIVIFYSNSSVQTGLIVDNDQLQQFSFLQTLVHYHTSIDIIHGVQSPCITLLERCNPRAILSRSIFSTERHKTIGIFVCGSKGYTEQIVQAVDSLKGNDKKITLDTWAENL